MATLTEPTLFTRRPPLLQPAYTDTVTATETAVVGYFEGHPNSGFNIVCKVDEDATVRVTDYDPGDGTLFGEWDYAATAAAPATIIHRPSAGAIKVEIIAGADNVVPDCRVYGMSQV